MSSRSYVPILLAGLLGALVTWLSFDQVHALEVERLRAAFSGAARDRLLVVQREVVHALGVVQDIGSFVDASRDLTRRQFREFVGPALKRNAGILALMWAPRVEVADLPAFVAKARRSYAQFRVAQLGEDDEGTTLSHKRPLFPVLYVQPYPINKPLLGLDLASDPAELSVLGTVAGAGGIWVSPPQFAPSATGEGTRISVYIPVHTRAEGDETESGEETEAPTQDSPTGELRGVAIGVFGVAEVVEGALADLGPSGVDLRFFSVGGAPASEPFYVHPSRVREAGSVAQTGGDERLDFREEIRIGNQRWQVVCSPAPGYFVPDNWGGMLILATGTAFTILAMVYLFTLIGRAEQVRLLVAERTLELERTNAALNKEIAERRRAVEAQQYLNATLEHRVAWRTAEAERRARDLEQFAYVASHDLKAPLRGIANLAGWLKEDLQDKLTPETAEQIDLLRDRVARMNALIEGLLTYSRIGRTGGRMEDVDSAELIADTIDSLAPAPGFRVEVAPRMPRLTADRLHLGQVFANLIGNAIKHHDRDRGVIRVSGRDLGHLCEFEVADDGPGIPAEYHDKVFHMFQILQVKDFGSDTGIGLALVKKLVEENGGSISLESGPGRGSLFRFSWSKRGPGSATTATAPSSAHGDNHD